MVIFSNDKIELEHDSYDKTYILTVNDKYGHYLDAIRLDEEDISDLVKAIEEEKMYGENL